MNVLAGYRGIWFDISSILLDEFELKWIDNLDQYPDIALNKYT